MRGGERTGAGRKPELQIFVSQGDEGDMGQSQEGTG